MRRECLCRARITGKLGLARRSIALQYEFLHRVREAFVLAGSRYIRSRFLHLVAGISHGNADSALFEHQDVVRHVTNCGNRFQGNFQQAGHRQHDLAFVCLGVGHVQIVRLRPSRRRVRAAGLLNFFLAALLGRVGIQSKRGVSKR